MNLRLKTGDISSISKRPLFFDANVLIYLFAGAISKSTTWAINAYAVILKNSIRHGCTLFIDAIVLSEFINRFLRLEYEKHLKAQKLSRQNFQFKDYRATNEGQKAAQDVELIVKNQILKLFQILHTTADNNDIAAMSLANKDFSDLLIIQTCIKNNCILITNDADFSGCSLDILTENKKLT